MGWPVGEQETETSSGSVRPSSDGSPRPPFEVLTEAELTEIRLRDIAFGDAADLGWIE